MRSLLLASALFVVAGPAASLKGNDMRQASIILASFLANAANMDKALPRPPLPTQPVVTDPFAYSDEDE